MKKSLDERVASAANAATAAKELERGFSNDLPDLPEFQSQSRQLRADLNFSLKQPWSKPGLFYLSATSANSEKLFYANHFNFPRFADLTGRIAGAVKADRVHFISPRLKSQLRDLKR